MRSFPDNGRTGSAYTERPDIGCPPVILQRPQALFRLSFSMQLGGEFKNLWDCLAPAGSSLFPFRFLLLPVKVFGLKINLP